MMECIDTHSHAIEKLYLATMNFLQGIAVGIVNHVLWFMGSWKGEQFLEHDLLDVEAISYH